MKVNLLIVLLLVTSHFSQLIPYTNRYTNKRFPLTVNTAASVIIADPSNINTFRLATGWTGNVANHPVSYEQSGNFISFNSGYCLLRTTGTTFNIYTLSSAYVATLINNPSAYTHIYSNEQLSLFEMGGNGFVGFINSNLLTFIKFNTINEIEFKQFTGRIVGRNVNCISFSNHFACFYTDNLNKCLMSTFDTLLNSVDAERDLELHGCNNSLGGKLFSIITNQFFICSLKNNNSVNCLISTNNSGILTFNSNSKLILSRCSLSFITFGLAAFKSNYIAFCSNGNLIMMQEIDSSLQFLNPGIQFTEVGSTSIIMPSVSRLSASSGVLFYSDSNNAVVYTMLIAPVCSSFTETGFTNGLLPINFATNINNAGYTGIKIILKTKPSSGNMVSMPGENPTDLITAYELLSYRAIGTAGTVTINFIGINDAQFISSICTLTITIIKCYTSCFTCNSIGTNSVHDCITCESGYFPIENLVSNCVNDATKPPNYYFDVNMYRLCHVSCGTCNAGTLNDCLTCSTGYHWSDTAKTSCLNVLPPGHYLDTQTDTYLPCYASCGSCSKGGTNDEHNCRTCRFALTYPIDNFPTNCVDNNTKPPNYYFDANRYKECYVSCGSCTGAGTAAVHRCTTCKVNYFPLDTNPALCYNDTTKPPNTYLDAVSKTYKVCHANCLTCSAGLTGANENCLTCQPNRFLHNSNCVTRCPSPTFGIHNNCVDTCPNYSVPNTNTNVCTICADSNQFLYKGRCIATQPSGTYIANVLYKILDDCYPSCDTCLTIGTKEDMKCTRCITNYFQLEDKPSQCFNVIPDGYFLPNPVGNPAQYHKCFDNCKTCSSKGTSILQNCLTCLTGYEINPKKTTNCVKSCDSDVSYWYNDDFDDFHCTESKVCPDKYPFYVPSSNECTLSCSKCIGCIIIPYYTYGDTCVPVCPDNSIVDEQLLKCVDLSDPQAMISSLTRYILTRPSNKVLVSDTIQFQFCNTTAIGWADCIDLATKMSLTIVDFQKCFDSLRIIYQLASNSYFWIGIFNILSEYSTPQVEYLVYDSSGGRLDLDYCKNDWVVLNKTIDMARNPSLSSVDRIRIQYGYNILDTNSTFYHNICATYTSEYQTDVVLEDRAKYIYPQTPMCEGSCNYGNFDYDLDESRIECICKTKEVVNLTRKDTFTKAQFKNMTLDQPVQYFTCYNLVLTIDIFYNNVGNYFMIIFFFLQFVFFIWFLAQGKKPLLSYMHSLLVESNNNSSPDGHYSPNPSPPPKTINEVLNDIKNEKGGEDKRKMCEEYVKVFMVNQNYVEKNDSDLNEENIASENSSHAIERKRSVNFEEQNTNTKNTYIYTQYQTDLQKAELTEYQLFLEKLRKYDNKSFYYIYWYNLKNRHRLLSLLLIRNIYEIMPYKLTMLFLSVTFDMFFNAILCHNGYISSLFVHQRRVDVGLCFGFGLCAALFSYFIMRLLEHIMEYKDQFRKLANAQNKDKDYYRKMYKRIRNLNIKFGFFYFFVFLIQLFMWYFITSFCATFNNTQYTWGIGIVVSLFFSWTCPFLFYLVNTAILYRGIKRKSM